MNISLEAAAVGGDPAAVEVLDQHVCEQGGVGEARSGAKARNWRPLTTSQAVDWIGGRPRRRL